MSERGHHDDLHATLVRLSRRQFLRRAGLLSAGLAALPVLAACGGGNPTATSASTGGGAATTAPTTAAATTAATKPATSAAGGATAPATSASPATGAASPATSASPAVSGGATPTISTKQYSGTLKLLQWSSFVPAADDEIKRQAAEWGKQHNVQVTIETVNGNDLQAKASAAVESKSGPDIIQMQYNWPWLYESACVDVSQIYGDLAKQLGGYYQVMETNAIVNGTARAIPYCIVSNAWVYRSDWIKQVGGQMPTTFDELHTLGQKLKAAGHPAGQSLGHAYGDANTMWYGFLWSYGGMEVQKDGKTVAINSPETLKAVEAAVALYKDAFDPGVLSWDDGSNNRAFLAEQVSATLNGASIYIAAKKQAPQIAQVIEHGVPLKGPAAQAVIHLNMSHAIMSYSKNIDAAKDFVYWLMQPDQYNKWLQVSGGYNVGPLHAYDNNPVWQQDPKLQPYRDSVQYGRWPGWPAQPGRAASEAISRYIIVDMFAKAAQGTAPKDAIANAESELKKVYGG